MNDKLFRTQTPHSVVFDAATKNATSPHNELDEADKSKELNDHLVPIVETESINSSPTCIDESSRSLHDNKITTQDNNITEQDASGIAKIHIKNHLESIEEESDLNATSQFLESVDKISDRFVSDNSNNHIKDTRVSIPVDDTEIHTSAASISKESLSSHMQKLDDELPEDDKLLYESLEKLQDQVLRLKAKQHSENTQKLPSTALKDNYQRIDTNKPMSDHVEYLEKKNIQDHLVKFDDSKQPRDQSIRETITPSQDKLNSNVSVTTNLGESHADSKADDHHHSNELQERIDRLKKNMHHVNDSLKDIQSQPDDSKL